MEEKVLMIEELSVVFPTLKGEIRAADHVSLAVPKGKITGLVGESGCGKSVTARAVMDLIRTPGRVTGGQIWLDGRNLTGMRKKERRMLRGRELSMIFQDPMTSLNPVMKAGKQIEEVVRLHEHVSGTEARQRTLEMMAAAGIPDPEGRYHCYPHQLSGGLRQRVMIAMAMICKPKLLIADEPTTALDVTVEAQILDLMKKLCGDGTSILLISHNLGVIARACDDVYVMYAGRIAEHAEVCALFDHPAHPYTKGLLNAVSSLRTGGEELDMIPGNVPNLLRLPAGCSFSPRCGRCRQECKERMPELREIASGHSVRCFGADSGSGQNMTGSETGGGTAE